MLKEIELGGNDGWQNADHLTQKKQYKMVMLGQKQSGKTALFNRLIYNKYTARYAETRDARFATKAVERCFNDCPPIDIVLWDVAGATLLGQTQEVILSHQVTHAVVIVVDPTQRDSLDVSFGLLAQTNAYFLKLGLKPVISLVFSKADLQKDAVYSALDKEAFVQKCNEHMGCDLLNHSVSATGSNQVLWFFQALANKIDNKPEDDFLPMSPYKASVVEQKIRMKNHFLYVTRLFYLQVRCFLDQVSPTG